MRTAEAQHNLTASRRELVGHDTQAQIMLLILQKSVTYRTSILLLVVFNMASAAILIGIVLYDSSRLAKKAALLRIG
jgi:hypothetical protein